MVERHRQQFHGPPEAPRDPQGPFPEGLRKFEEVGEGSRRFEEVGEGRESQRKFEKFELERERERERVWKLSNVIPPCRSDTRMPTVTN